MSDEELGGLIIVTQAFRCMLQPIVVGLKFVYPLLEGVDALSEVGDVLDPVDSMRITHGVHLVRPCMESGEFLG